MENVVSSQGQEVDQRADATDQTRLSRVPMRPRADTLENSRRFFDNRFVYAVVSQRSRGLSIGINLSPEQLCTFDCIYCEVRRNGAAHEGGVDLTARSEEHTSELQSPSFI